MLFIAEILIWYLLLLVAAKFADKVSVNCQTGELKGGWLITYTVSAAILANIETTQFIHVFGMGIPGGIVPFACLFLATDVASELYGRKFSLSLVGYSCIGMLLSSLIIYMFSLNDGIMPSFRNTLISTLRIAFASISVYYVCGMLDVDIYHQIGKRSRYKWLRNNAATITAQFVNAFLFIILAFGWIGIAPIMNNWLISVCLALLDTPMIYIITGKDRKLSKLKSFSN